MKRMFLLACLAACGGSKDTARPPVETATSSPDPASLVVADTVTVELPLSLPAQLYVEHDAALYARSAGIIEAIQADLGSRVEAGQVLVRLESADQEIALAQARVRYANAKI
ncbi:MAG TPA: biotin/lipoyl-binding protein, partial [Gemmatimonadales bacterium]|nr:biotin/lipoyl-binding protein [Gemmatimonadales bacterium]